MLSSTEAQVYRHPSWNALKVQNYHVNPVNAYDFLCRYLDNPELFDRQIHEQILTSLQEDFLGWGAYGLQFVKQPDGTLKFTNPSFPDQSLEELAVRGINLKILQGKPFERELSEYDLAAQLTSFASSAPIGSVCVWSSPPGNQTEYPHQMSITYVGQIEGDESNPSNRKMKVELFVHKMSLEGHRQLVKKYDKQAEPQLNDAWFVGHLIPLGIRDREQTMLEMKEAIADLEYQGLVQSEASILSFLEAQVLERAIPQIQEYSFFLSTVFRNCFNTVGLNLAQEDVDLLERAYSLGYRSILAQINQTGNPVVTAATFLEDFYAYEAMAQKVRQHNSVASEDLFQASNLLDSLEARYGALGPRSVGGKGCPAGMLVGFGFALTGPVAFAFKPGGLRISNPDNDIWKCKACGHVHHIDAKNGKLYAKCQNPKCGASGKCA